MWCVWIYSECKGSPPRRVRGGVMVVRTGEAVADGVAKGGGVLAEDHWVRVPRGHVVARGMPDNGG